MAGQEVPSTPQGQQGALAGLAAIPAHPSCFLWGILALHALKGVSSVVCQAGFAH